MAKLLTKIWKTTSGFFFETEEEALRLERKEAIARCLLRARETALASEIAEFKLALAEWERHRGSLTSGVRYPSDPRFEHKIPHGFEKVLMDELEAAGVLAPLKLSGQDE